MPNTFRYHEFTSVEQLSELRRYVTDGTDLAIGTGHPQGGNALGEDPATSVVGPDFQRPRHASTSSRATRRSSRASVTVNPQLTVMALADYAAPSVLAGRLTPDHIRCAACRSSSSVPSCATSTRRRRPCGWRPTAPCEVEMLGRTTRHVPGRRPPLRARPRRAGSSPAARSSTRSRSTASGAGPRRARRSRRAGSRRRRPTHEAKMVFGSCRVAVPHEPPYSLRKDQDSRGREIDALHALALRMCDQAAGGVADAAAHARRPGLRRRGLAGHEASSSARAARPTSRRASRSPTSRSTRTCTSTRGASRSCAGCCRRSPPR